MGNFFVENVVSQHCFYVAQLQLLFQSTNRTAEFASLWCKCTRVLMKPEDRASVSTSVTGAESLKTSADWSSLDSKSIKCIWLQFFRFITPILFVLVCMNHLCVTHWKTLFRPVCAVWMDPTVCLILFIPPHFCLRFVYDLFDSQVDLNVTIAIWSSFPSSADSLCRCESYLFFFFQQRDFLYFMASQPSSQRLTVFIHTDYKAARRTCSYSWKCMAIQSFSAAKSFWLQHFCQHFLVRWKNYFSWAGDKMDETFVTDVDISHATGVARVSFAHSILFSFPRISVPLIGQPNLWPNIPFNAEVFKLNETNSAGNW